MNIRTITCFADPGFPVDDERLAAAGLAAATIRAALEEAGYTVQTVRLAITPFPRVLGQSGQGGAGQVTQLALDLEAACFVNKIDYATLGPARPSDGQAFYEALPAAVGATERVFAAASIADAAGGLSLRKSVV